MKHFANKKDKQNSNSKEELIQRIEVKDTPFTVVTTEEGSFGCMGKWRLTEVKETQREIKEELAAMTWNRILQVTMLLCEEIYTSKMFNENNLK